MRNALMQPATDSDARWLALLIRQGLLTIVRGIERRYNLKPSQGRSGDEDLDRSGG